MNSVRCPTPLAVGWRRLTGKGTVDVWEEAEGRLWRSGEVEYEGSGSREAVAVLECVQDLLRSSSSMYLHAQAGERAQVPGWVCGVGVSRVLGSSSSSWRRRPVHDDESDDVVRTSA